MSSLVEVFYHLSVERSGRRRVVIVFCVCSMFVSYLIEYLLVMLSRSIGCLVWIMWSSSCLLLVMLSLKLMYLLRRWVSWLTLVRCGRLVCKLRMGLVVCFLIEPMTQTSFILSLRRIMCGIIADDRSIYNKRIQEILCCKICSRYDVPSFGGIPTQNSTKLN